MWKSSVQVKGPYHSTVPTVVFSLLCGSKISQPQRDWHSGWEVFVAGAGLHFIGYLAASITSFPLATRSNSGFFLNCDKIHITYNYHLNPF